MKLTTSYNAWNAAIHKIDRICMPLTNPEIYRSVHENQTLGDV